MVKAKSFLDKLKSKWEEGKFVCVGLDSDYAKLPQFLKKSYSKDEAIFQFNKAIINATADLVCAFKLNSAFYEAEGLEGWKALKETIVYIRGRHPDLPVILDAKRADIGNANDGYVKAIFDGLGVEAVTVHPYLGKDSLEPFLKYKDKGIIVLVKTSNPGSGEFQDLRVGQGNKLLYEMVAQKVALSWNTFGNCAVMVGATYPKELANVRKIVGEMPILIPGIGAQGGEIKATVEAGVNKKNQGIIISSSRAIIFTSLGENFAKSARAATQKLHTEILRCRQLIYEQKHKKLHFARTKLHPEGLTKPQEHLIEKLFEIGAIKFGQFKFKLHDVHPEVPLAPMYIDFRVPRRFPEVKRLIVDVLEDLVKNLTFDLLADIPTAATPFVSTLSDRLEIAFITPRIDSKLHGSGAKIDGMLAEDKGKKVVVIDDLVTRADSKLEAIKILEDHGLKVEDVVVLVDRQQGGREELQKRGYKLHFAFTLSQMLKFYLRIGKIDGNEFKRINKGLWEMNKYLV